MSKAKGSRVERKAMRWYESKGYRCTKSGGSLGCWDIIGIGAADVLLIQVKANRWCAGKELANIIAFSVPPNCQKIVLRWDDYARAPEIRKYSVPHEHAAPMQ